MIRYIILSFLFCFTAFNVFAQAPVVEKAVYSDVSVPLRDIPPVVRIPKDSLEVEEEHEVPNKFRQVPPGFIPDLAIQQVYTDASSTITTVPMVNVDGSTNASNTGRVTPPDPAGDVGPNHYVQVVNSLLQVFSKSGASLYGPVQTSTLWSGFTGNWTGHNDGDAIVLYDENADRWIISQFAIKCGTYPNYTQYEMIAVSVTGDPLGAYYRYAFAFDHMPDYPKLGVWNDGYYMAINRFNTNASGSPYVGAAGCVMERSKMLSGDPSAMMIYFKTETLGGSGSGTGSSCYSLLPSDCDGAFPAAGTPNYFVYSWGTPELRLWALHTDWTTPANSTFTYVTALPVTAYTMMGSGSVKEHGTLSLDGLGDRLMFRNQYRNFGSYETFVTCHSVNTGSSIAGIRWYEYRKTGSVFSLYQQSTYAPADGKSRWMGSIAMNASGDIGLAYSVSSSAMYPSIYFTGRKAADPINQMTFPEGLIQAGTVSMTTYSRWGDYSALNVDPSDNSTFWTTQEYVGTYGGWCPWATRIASFKIAYIPVIATLPASSITATTATLNGTVNPTGLSSTFHFEYGTTSGYGNSTPIVSAGSGMTNVSVSAPITGLVAGNTYHFRLVGVNSEGTANGSDQSFVAGAAILSTSAASAITLTTATTGGSLVSDGGSAITARGVCWGAAINPTISGSHTTDGNGPGAFTSALTGLTANTPYHIRAYATNSTGTFYGNDLTFSTYCANYTLPFTEGFPGVTIPACWSQYDRQMNGKLWSFGVITGQSPNPALTGNYAFLNSRAYGSGVPENVDLVSPTLDLSIYASVYLKFNHYFKSGTGVSSGTLSYSTDNGITWTEIQQWTATFVSNPESFNQVIPGVGGSNQVKFRWNYTGTYGYYWAIDDITVSVSGLWLGGASGAPTDWHTAANWDGTVIPTGTTNVYIPLKNSMPVINTTGAACNNLILGSGAHLTIGAGWTLTVNGIVVIY